uniref:head maturation protease, ClpP-related n=1 Tax=Parendozoicomonas sp. Alg238-R29 TaxID=2993446 RepID=UPI00248DE4C8
MKTNAQSNKPWFTLKNQADQPAELLIYDVIGDWQGLSAKDLVSELKNITSDEMTVRINSPGGSVFDGIAIYNALRYHPANIHVRIEGLAASIASVIAMAGDTITMAENSLMMIHNPLGWVGGEAEDMRRTADMLDKATEAIALSYSGKSGRPVDDITPLMASETWMTAEEAQGNGFIDVVDKPVQLAASLDLSIFQNVPEGLKSQLQNQAHTQTQTLPTSPPTPKTSPQSKNTSALSVVQLCNQAGYPELAESLLRTGATVEDVQTRLASCDTIKTLCAAAQSDQAPAYIQAGKSVEQVRTELFEQ